MAAAAGLVLHQQTNDQVLSPKAEAKARALARAWPKAEPVKNDDLRRHDAHHERVRSSSGCCLVGGKDYGCSDYTDGLRQST